MKKIVIALLLMAAGISVAEALVCNKGSLSGQYRYQFSNRVGMMTFNGTGGYTLSGFVVSGSSTTPVTGSGTYTINVECVAILKATTGTLLTIYLDSLNTVPATTLAYHGTMLGGTLTRRVGK